MTGERTETDSKEKERETIRRIIHRENLLQLWCICVCSCARVYVARPPRISTASSSRNPLKVVFFWPRAARATRGTYSLTYTYWLCLTLYQCEKATWELKTNKSNKSNFAAAAPYARVTRDMCSVQQACPDAERDEWMRRDDVSAVAARPIRAEVSAEERESLCRGMCRNGEYVVAGVYGFFVQSMFFFFFF